MCCERAITFVPKLIGRVTSHWMYPLSNTTSLFLEILWWAYHWLSQVRLWTISWKFYKAVTIVSRYFSGSCLSAKAYHIGECNLDFLEISHFLITPILPIITFWKRDFHLVLVMRDILSTWKIEIFPRFEQTQFFSQRGSKRCVYIWLGERCCLVFMNR